LNLLIDSCASVPRRMPQTDSTVTTGKYQRGWCVPASAPETNDNATSTAAAAAPWTSSRARATRAQTKPPRMAATKLTDRFVTRYARDGTSPILRPKAAMAAAIPTITRTKQTASPATTAAMLRKTRMEEYRAREAVSAIGKCRPTSNALALLPRPRVTLARQLGSTPRRYFAY